MGYRSADDSSELKTPPAHEVSWLAYDRDTGKRVGPVRAFDAKRVAAELYSVDVETVEVKRLW